MTKKEYNSCVDNYADRLYRFLLKGTKDSENAKDIVQESFEKLWRNKEEVAISKAKSYLFTVAYNAMIDSFRRNKKYEVLSCSTSTTTSSCCQPHCDLNEVLHKAIEQLPPEQQSTVLLRDYEGYSYTEIGQITGLTESQVKVYIFRARQFLRSYIGSIEKVI